MNSKGVHPLAREAEADRLMSPGEVAQIFRVDPKTVNRWANKGKLKRIMTPGGHSRYRLSDVKALLERDE